MNLWHFTCIRASRAIRADGVINLAVQTELAGLHLIWLTDIRMRTEVGSPLRLRLGLPWHHMRPECIPERFPCDPVGARFEVSVDIQDHPHIHPFARLAQDFPEAARMYRSLPGAQPHRWWFATSPVHLQQPATSALIGVPRD